MSYTIENLETDVEKYSFLDTASDICNNLGSDAYWTYMRKKISNFEVRVARDWKKTIQGFVIYEKGYRCTKNNEGVINCNKKHIDTWYIQLICAKIQGLGKILMEDFITEAWRAKQQFITLSAIRIKISYYAKFHFKVALGCQEDEEITNIVQQMQKCYTTQKESTCEETLKIEWSKIVNSGMASANLKKKHNEKMEASNKVPIITKDEKKKMEEAEDGIYMTLCLDTYNKKVWDGLGPPQDQTPTADSKDQRTVTRENKTGRSAFVLSVPPKEVTSKDKLMGNGRTRQNIITDPSPKRQKTENK